MARNTRAITGLPSRVGMMKIKYEVFAIVVATTALCSDIRLADAQTVDSDEQVNPLIYIVLDTSGSMNGSINDAEGNTRLTKALAELAGGVKIPAGQTKITKAVCPDTCDENDTTCQNCPTANAFKLPFPVWKCGASSCGYTYELKQIPGNARIARPSGASDSVGNSASEINAYHTLINNNYKSDGIIHAYQSSVKFGAVGLAVGSGGSVAGSDASVIQLAADLAGGRVDGILRSTIIWNDVNGINSDSDIDFHCAIYRNNTMIDKIDYCTKHGSGSGNNDTGGVLDVDVIYPSSNNIRLTEYGYENPLGIENITWANVDKLQKDDVIYFYAVPYSMHGYLVKGFRAEIAYKDKNGCASMYTFNYDKDIPGSTSHSSCGFGVDSLSLDFPIARVTYLGKDSSGEPRFDVDSIGSFGGKSIEVNPKMSGNAGSPDNIYGFTARESGIEGVVYGRKDLESKAYKKPSNCAWDVGIWDSNPDAPAPLFYPTPSSNKTDIIESNLRLVDAMRTYRADSATPIGESLADMYFMFGADSANLSTVDQGLVKRKKAPASNAVLTDDAYACRKKAVILITDGVPFGSGIKGESSGNNHGYTNDIWHDARWLNGKGGGEEIKTYVIAYAFGDSAGDNIDNQDPADETTAAYRLNMTAWKGGTCRNPVTHKIIPPDDTAAYNEMLSNDNIADRRCFFSAANGNALRKAMSEALSDTLQGTVSKTAVASSAALGYVNNVTENGKYQNGYYNVFSGYEITPGLVRRAILQREATVCNTTSGKFETGQQYIDLATILSCRLNKNCMNTGDLSCAFGAKECTQIRKDIANASSTIRNRTPCASQGEGVEDIIGNFNDCISNRYIFAGDYSRDRNEILPDNISLSQLEDTGDGRQIGLIADAYGKSQDYNFITSMDIRDNQNIRSYYSRDSANYILSPYECGSDLDCVKEGSEGYCDLGRCISGSDYHAVSSCDSESAPGGKICIAGKLRNLYAEADACERHESVWVKEDDENDVLPMSNTFPDGYRFARGCEEGEVCHAGRCMPGTIKRGNIRDFLATLPLGTIEFATPVPVEPPLHNVKSASYQQFMKEYWNRDNMLMVAANDGMIHAFILGQNKDRSEYDVDPGIRGNADPLPLKEGDELWAFIPKAMMPKLKNLTNMGQQSLINAAPVVADVPKRTFTGTSYIEEWRTVLVGGFGDGARGYYALDITDPLSPSILWEIDNQWQADTNISDYPHLGDTNDFLSATALQSNRKSLSPNSDNMKGFPFADLGFSSAQPLITRMIIDDQIETVAILPGGSRNANQDDIGVIYIVRLFPNESQKDQKNLLIAAIYTQHEVTGSPAVYPNQFNAIAQRLYFGDRSGNFYALDVRDFKPDRWKQGAYDDNVKVAGSSMDLLKPAFGPDCGHIPDEFNGITYKPAVSVYTKGNYPTLQIVFGTGDNTSLHTSSTDRNYVAKFFDVHTSGGYRLNAVDAYSTVQAPELYVFNPPAGLDGVIEQTSDLCGGDIKFNVVTKDGTGKAFIPTQKMSGSAVTYNFDSYFPTYVTSNDTTTPYASMCHVGNASIFKMTSPRHPHRTFATNVRNSANPIQIASSLDSRGFIELAPGTKVYGLEVTSQQLCIAGSNMEIAAPRLIAQTGIETNDVLGGGQHDELRDNLTDIANFALNLDAISPNVTPISWASMYE